MIAHKTWNGVTLLLAPLMLMNIAAHSAQREHKKCAATSQQMEQYEKLWKTRGFHHYVKHIEDVLNIATDVATIIGYYAYTKTKFSHKKIIFQERHPGITCLALLPSQHLATGSDRDYLINIWHYPTQRHTHTLTGHTRVISALAALAYPRLVSGSADETIKVWNFMTGVCEHTLIGHDGAIHALVALSPRLIASAQNNSFNVRIWDPLTGLCKKILKNSGNDIVRSLGILPNGNLITTHYDYMKYWSSSGGVYKYHNFYRGESGISCIISTPDGSIIKINRALCAKEAALSMYNSRAQTWYTPKIALSAPHSLAYHDGQVLVGDARGAISIIDMSTKKQTQRLCIHDNHDNNDNRANTVSGLVLITDESFIASCSEGCMHLFNQEIDFSDVMPTDDVTSSTKTCCTIS